MIFGLKLAGIILGVYGGFKLAGLGIAWLKHGFRELKPPEDD